jgi:hypothetical protein
VRRLSFKTQFKIEFLGPFNGPKKSRKKSLISIAQIYMWAVAKPAVMQVMQCMTKNFPKNI